MATIVLYFNSLHLSSLVSFLYCLLLMNPFHSSLFLYTLPSHIALHPSSITLSLFPFSLPTSIHFLFLKAKFILVTFSTFTYFGLYTFHCPFPAFISPSFFLWFCFLSFHNFSILYSNFVLNFSFLFILISYTYFALRIENINILS